MSQVSALQEHLSIQFPDSVSFPNPGEGVEKPLLIDVETEA